MTFLADFLTAAIAVWSILAAIAALYILACFLERTHDHGNRR